MTTSIRSYKAIGAVLAAAFTLAAGCDADHVLGSGQSGPPDGGDEGTVGHAGTWGTDPGGSSGAGGVAGVTGAAGVTGVTGAAGAVGGSTGAAGLKAGPLGPSQSWTGYLEQATFSSGSDQAKLTFAEDANGIVAGTIVFGMGTPPPPATNPNVGYPVGVSGHHGLSEEPGGYVAEGYSYTFDGGTLETHRLRFNVNMAQLWAGWCALQTQADGGSSACVPNWPESTDGQSCWLTNPNNNQMTMYDCGKVVLCGDMGMCVCTASGCTFDQMGTYSSSFDLFMNGDALSGSARGAGGGTYHFVRD